MAKENPLYEQPEQEPSVYAPEDMVPPEPDAATGDGQPQVLVNPTSTVPRVALPGEGEGGPLGCCLGVTIGLLLSMLLGLAIFGNLSSVVVNGTQHVELSTILRVALAICGAIGVVAGGIIGWRIGKKIYREYEPPVVKERRRKKTSSRAARL